VVEEGSVGKGGVVEGRKSGEGEYASLALGGTEAPG